MTTYLKEEVLTKSTEYFKGDEFAASTWIKKYSLKFLDRNGTEKSLECTPDDMHRRLAKEFARIEAKYPNSISEEKIYELIKDFVYIVPQGGSMSGIGNNHIIQSLSNCFVIGNPPGSDSYGGILRIDEEQLQLCKRRGGVGHDLSDLRPSGSPVTNAALSSSGVTSFMERYSNSTREVGQNNRRGALMLSLSIKHPDAEKFIDMKVDTTKVTGANCSVKVTDEFLRCVETGSVFLQTFPINSSNDDLFGVGKLPDLSTLEEGKLYFGVKKNTSYRLVDARKLWKKLIHNAWKSAEPGILFWDTITRESPADCYPGFETTSTNPCGEIPMNPYDSCRLMSINLYSYVKNPFTPQAEFDYELFKAHSEIAQRLMDDMIDLELEKIDEIIKKIESDPESESLKRVELELWTKIKDTTSKGRRTGLGVTAEADMLAAMGLVYGSDKSIEFSESVHKTLALSAYKSSIQIASERGCFSIWNDKLESSNPFIQRVLSNLDAKTLRLYKKSGRRNIACLTLAPTGTTSILTQTTSGIEPAFQIAYRRRRKTEDKALAVFTDSQGDMFEEYNIFHHKFVDWYMISTGHKGSQRNSVISKLQKLTEEQFKDLVKKSPYYKSTAMDVDWVAKVELQGRVQKWIDHSISCTTNLPKDATEEMVNKVYLAAWKSGAKGCTVYRDGSRDGILLKTPSKKKVYQRPDILNAKVVRFVNGSEKWIAFIGILDGKPSELFSGAIDDDIKYLPKSITEGQIVRTILPDGTKRYDFQYDIGHGYKNHLPNISQSFNPEYYNYARFVSTLLRENVELTKIVSTLDGLDCGDTINVWNRGVARALKSFISDGTISTKKCEYCGSDLVFEGGCEHCPGCGDSKCD